MTLTLFQPAHASAPSGSLSGLCITGMPADVYHKRPEISSHDLALIGSAPLKYKYGRDHPTRQTPAMAEGEAFHLIVLEPLLFGDRVTVIPETYPAPEDHAAVRRKKNPIPVGTPLPWNGNAGYCEDWLAANANGKILLKSQRASELWEMANILKGDPDAAKLLSAPVASEVSIFWEDSGVHRRGRIDRLRAGNVIVDIKTTTCAESEVFSNQAAALGYFVQAATYADAMEQITGYPHAFWWIAVESEPPYISACYECSPEGMDLGRAGRAGNLDRYKECVRTGVWGGYQSGLHQLLPPPWSMKKAGI